MDSQGKIGKRLCTPTHNIRVEQDSPPEWTQEAYQPPLIKYSMCCPVGGGGVSWAAAPLAVVPPVLSWPGGTPGGHPSGWGTLCPDLAGGYPRWVPPGWGTPILTWLGVPQVGAPWLGYPPSWPDQGGTPGGYPWLGYSPSWPGREVSLWLGYPPPHRCGQIDTCKNSILRGQ